jgi:hypothetical protein
VADTAYDAVLHQWREPQKVIRLDHVRFMRWLVERGQLEHWPSGPPSGPVAELLASSSRACRACRACRADTAHEVVAPVSRGQVYLRCVACGTVAHVPKERG